MSKAGQLQVAVVCQYRVERKRSDETKCWVNIYQLLKRISQDNPFILKVKTTSPDCVHKMLPCGLACVNKQLG